MSRISRTKTTAGKITYKKDTQKVVSNITSVHLLALAFRRYLSFQVQHIFSSFVYIHLTLIKMASASGENQAQPVNNLPTFWLDTNTQPKKEWLFTLDPLATRHLISDGLRTLVYPIIRQIGVCFYPKAIDTNAFRDLTSLVFSLEKPDGDDTSSQPGFLTPG